MFKWCATDEDLEERNPERPNVRLACVVVMAAGSFRRKILKAHNKLHANITNCCVTHLRCTICQVTSEGLGGTEVILLGKSEINQHRDILIGKKNVRRSEERISSK